MGSRKWKICMALLFIVVSLFEGWDCSDVCGCFSGDKTLCFAVVTAVEVSGEGVGMLMLFVIRSLYLLVLVFGLIIWCRSRLEETITHFYRTGIAWILWIHQKVRLVKCYVDVVTCTMGLLGALAVLIKLTDAANGGEVTLKGALAVLIKLTDAANGGEVTLKALKDFFSSASIFLRSLQNLP